MRSANGCCSIRRSSMIHLVGSCKTASALAWSKSLRILSDGGELQKFRNGTRATKTRLLFNRPQSDKNRIRQEQRSRWFGDEASTTRTVLKSLAGLVSSQSWCVGPCGKQICVLVDLLKLFFRGGIASLFFVPNHPQLIGLEAVSVSILIMRCTQNTRPKHSTEVYPSS